MFPPGPRQEQSDWGGLGSSWPLSGHLWALEAHQGQGDWVFLGGKGEGGGLPLPEHLAPGS